MAQPRLNTGAERLHASRQIKARRAVIFAMRPQGEAIRHRPPRISEQRGPHSHAVTVRGNENLFELTVMARQRDKPDDLAIGISYRHLPAASNFRLDAGAQNTKGWRRCELYAGG